ncbi:MAG: Phosphoesterase [Frankiales bacterium]|jgi:2'-5' RNA ligase|nr:Phosphoesterase [Frankiales bacterium]MCW2708396.1 Phosphoesterase [Frankiales bacterium]
MARSSARRDIGVAIGIPEPYTSELQGWRERLGDSNATQIPPHVTLLPPTALRTDDLQAVEAHLLEVACRHEPFIMHLRGSGTFRPISPVVFVPLVQGISECERIEAQVRSGPLQREVTFPYHPHVTVAHEVSEQQLDRAFEDLADYDARFRVWGFTMFEKGRDNVWRPQRDFPFDSPLPGPLPPAEPG